MKYTRISFNSTDWQRPTGEARTTESSGSYNQIHGFGHEDWLFRSDWVIGDWRYAFLQGINKSRNKLLREAQPLDIALFTIDPDGRRRIVGEILDAECLGDNQAEAAVDIFKERGWFAQMEEDVRRVNGNARALLDAAYAPHVLNVRFRLQNVRRFNDRYVRADSGLMRLSRYQLYGDPDATSPGQANRSAGRAGTDSLPDAQRFTRRGTDSVECTPEHAWMQEKLMRALRKEYPRAQILREEAGIDVSVRTKDAVILFEIKSDLQPRTVIRQALGQIIEYGYHPLRSYSVPPLLVIVGRSQLAASDKEYLEMLRRDFGLPLEYRVVSI